MTGRRAGAWIAAGCGALAAAAAACLWLASEGPGYEAEDGGRPEGTAGADASAAAGSARRGAAQSSATASSDATVEIDDGEMPEGATATIRGTVRDDLGQPIAGAWVSAAARAWGAEGEWPDGTATQSSADGTYEIPELAPSAVWGLEAFATGHAHVTPAKAVVFSPRRLEAAYDVVLPRNGSIAVTVLDAAGSPVAHTDEILQAGPEDFSGFDADGLPPGRYRVLVDVEGHAGDSRVVEVTAGEVTKAEFVVADGVEISGVLVDSDGTPVRRTKVVAIVADAALSPFDGAAVTESDGSFLIRGLRRTRYRLALADLRLVADGPGDIVAPATGVTLRLRDDAKVTFRLVYPPGFPAADRSAEVAIHVDVNGTDIRPSPRWELDQGTIRVPGGENAELVMTVLHCATVRRRFNVRPGELLDLGDIGPELARDVDGRVVDANGNPVKGAYVAYSAGNFASRATSDASGAFLIQRVPPLGVTLDVGKMGYVQTRVAVADDATAPVTVMLARGGLLWVRAATRGGSPLASVAIRVDDSGGAPFPFAPKALDAHGECAARLPPGKWRITVAGCAPVEADVREGATTSVRVRPAAR